jgi:cytochrome P450
VRDRKHGSSFYQAVKRVLYLPFGLGRRVCIGEGFAMLELELVLSELLKRFELRTLNPSEPELVGTLTLRPRGELRIALAEVPA